MKKFVLSFVLLGLAALSQIHGQSFQKYQRPQINCKTNAKISSPGFAVEFTPVRIVLDSPNVNMIRQVDVYLDNKHIGRKTSPYFYWWVNTKSNPLPPGHYKIKVKYITKCGNGAMLQKDLQIAKLR